MKLILLAIFFLLLCAVFVYIRFSSTQESLAHIGFYVRNLTESDAFYRPLLRELGYDVILEMSNCVAYGKRGVPILEIYTGKEPSARLHIALNVSGKNQVALFHAKALELGAQDNGKPGYRDYFPGYYASFVVDPNGHNVEALYWENKRSR